MDTHYPLQPVHDPGTLPARPVGRSLSVLGIWKAYRGDQYVVRDISFTVEPGRFLTLLGPSGSGKTTMLTMVAGFELPSRGQILVDGQDVARQPPRLRNFGVVFQGYALFPHMSAVENVEFALRMRRVARQERRRRALAMLEKMELTAFADRHPRELSGGQQQRVALARALVFEPDALLLDEPLGALDKKLREALQVEIKQIQRQVGVSVLYVTHDQDEAMMMSDHIAVMRNGKIIQLGSPMDMYLHPATPFVANFLGETNLVPCVDCGPDSAFTRVRFPNGQLGRTREPRQGRARAGGSSILVSVRPERIRLLAPGEPCEDAIEGVILEGTFLGKQVRLIIQALGMQIVATTTEYEPLQELSVGRAVRLSWSPDDAQILALDPDDSEPEPAQP
ncbi:MAG: ABC transporter ATP-binding protein [Acetobacteraceae bacterium]